MVVVENYRRAIEELTIKDKNSKCSYYACWKISGLHYEDLPDGSKESYLFIQFFKVLESFRNNCGVWIYFAEG